MHLNSNIISIFWNIPSFIYCEDFTNYTPYSKNKITWSNSYVICRSANFTLKILNEIKHLSAEADLILWLNFVGAFWSLVDIPLVPFLDRFFGWSAEFGNFVLEKARSICWWMLLPTQRNKIIQSTDWHELHPTDSKKRTTFVL